MNAAVRTHKKHINTHVHTITLFSPLSYTQTSAQRKCQLWFICVIIQLWNLKRRLGRQWWIIQTDVFLCVCTACVILNMCVIKVLQRRPSANQSLKQSQNRGKKKKSHQLFYSDGLPPDGTHISRRKHKLCLTLKHTNTCNPMSVHTFRARQPWKKRKWKRERERKQTGNKKREHNKQRKKKLTHKQWSNCSHHSWLLGDPCCHGKWCGRCHGLGLTPSSVFHCC